MLLLKEVRMMKNNCEIVQDLLPMYVEGLTSESSNQFVEEHIDSCPECLNYYKTIKEDLPLEETSYSHAEIEDQELIKDIKQRIKNRTFIVALVGMLIGLFFALPWFPFTITGGLALLLLVGVIVYLLR